MSSIASLDAQAAARKERLAKLNSLKRKQPPTDSASSFTDTATDGGSAGSLQPTKDTNTLLSGRNYDVELRAPKMGFASAPNEGQETLEDAAHQIVETTKALQMEDEKNDKPIDLFNLQPKKPNWDLKRDLDLKLQKLSGKTDIAIAKMIKARIEESRQKKIKQKTEGDEAGDMDGNVAAMVQEREREREAEAKKDEDSDSS